MKMSVSLQPYLHTTLQPRMNGTGTAPDPLGGDGLFSDLLQAELASGQRVIAAEEILAELDGSPDWEFDRAFGDGSSLDAERTAQTPVSRQSILNKISDVARTFGVDEDLVREVVRAESNFNPNAVSRAGAKGLMQLMDSTARAMHVRNAYNPDENLAGGTRYLRSLLDRYDGNVKVALAAYNAGPGRIDRLGIDTDEELEARYDQLPRETQRYVAKIMQRLNGGGTS
jgi:soluble lytic murein transglycosylase-like protein